MGSDCQIAKATLYYKSKSKGLHKAVLIDVKKAFNSVSLEKLRQIIIRKYPETGKILLAFIEIYSHL